MLHFSVCVFVYFGIFRFVLLQGAAYCIVFTAEIT